MFARLSKDARAWYRRVLRRAGLGDDRPRALINIRLLNPCTFQQPTTRPKDPSHRSARTRDTTHVSGVRCVVVVKYSTRDGTVCRSAAQGEQPIRGRRTRGQQPAAQGEQPIRGRSKRGSSQPPRESSREETSRTRRTSC